VGDRNLIIVHNSDVLPDRDFREIAKRVRRLDPQIHAFVVTEKKRSRAAQLAQFLRPTLFVEIEPVPGLRLRRGCVARGPRGQGKMAVYRVLEAGGLRVPTWCEVVPGPRLDPGEWGPWVVVKPDHGLRGIDVEAMATAELCFRAPEQLPEDHLGRSGPLLAQRYIPTVDGPAYYRATTCFGEPIFAIHYFHPPGVLPEDPSGRPTIAVHRPYAARLAEDPDVLALARRVHALFPNVPAIGSDFMRHRDTGELWIAEVNLSSVWALSSEVGIRFQAARGLDLYQQFGALDRAAEAMAAATRRLAR
jgi:hypothetical protein